MNETTARCVPAPSPALFIAGPDCRVALFIFVLVGLQVSGRVWLTFERHELGAYRRSFPHVFGELAKAAGGVLQRRPDCFVGRGSQMLGALVSLGRPGGEGERFLRERRNRYGLWDPKPFGCPSPPPELLWLPSDSLGCSLS